MAQYTINLTIAQDTALTQMGITDLEAYIKKICDSHIKQKLDADWALKTDAEKDAFLNP